MTDRPRRPRRGTDLSRLPTTADAAETTAMRDHVSDQQGRRALFSAGPGDAPADPPPATTGAVVVECGSCGERTVLSPVTALSHAVPSLHLPYLKPGHGSWMRCPACRRRTWVSLHIQL